MAPTDEQIRIAGFDNVEEIRQFLRGLRQAEAENNRNAMVALVRYPFALYSGGKVRKRYGSRAALLAGFGKIFTAHVRTQIRAARLDTLFFNYQGAMIGNGDVWFDKKDKGIAIKAVNPGPLSLSLRGGVPIRRAAVAVR